MPVEGKLEDPKILRLRTILVSGKVDGVPYEVMLNADNKAIFVEMAGKRIAYDTADIIQDAYASFVEKKKQK